MEFMLTISHSRGDDGFGFKRVPKGNLSDFHKLLSYDLVVLSFGLNSVRKQQYESIRKRVATSESHQECHARSANHHCWSWRQRQKSWFQIWDQFNGSKTDWSSRKKLLPAQELLFGIYLMPWVVVDRWKNGQKINLLPRIWHISVQKDIKKLHGCSMMPWWIIIVKIKPE